MAMGCNLYSHFEEIGFVLAIAVFNVCFSQNAISVRLVGGAISPYEGQVEAYRSGSGWSPVLRSSWGFADADVVCNELGHPGAMSWGWRENALDGDGRLRIVNVRCVGNETSLMQCPHATTYRYQTAATVSCNYDGYLGCYRNDRSDPVFSQYIKYSQRMTIQKCLEYCHTRNTTYAGLLSGNRCYCGNQDSRYARYGRVSSELCDARCRGDYDRMCGGLNEIAIYLASMSSCGGHRNGNGTIFSPGFPGILTPGKNYHCVWSITTTYGTTVELTFSLFSQMGQEDHVVIYEKPDNTFLEIGRMDFSTSAAVWRSCSNEVYVEFYSEATSDTVGEVGGGMFILEFKEIPTVCEIPIVSNPNADFTVGGFCPYKYTVTCHEGYRLSTLHSQVWCQESGTWNDNIPTCFVVDCGDPGYVTNADRDGDSFTYADTVKYSCHEGYSSTGNDVILCTGTGKWTEKPHCVRNVTTVVTLFSEKEEKHFEGSRYIINLCVAMVIAILIIAASLAVVFWIRRRNLEKRNVGLTSLIRRLPKQSIRRIGNYDSSEVIANRAQERIVANGVPASEMVMTPSKNLTVLGPRDRQGRSAGTAQNEKSPRRNNSECPGDGQCQHTDVTKVTCETPGGARTTLKNNGSCIYEVHGYETVKRELNHDNIPDACCGTGFVDNIAYDSIQTGRSTHPVWRAHHH